MNIEVSQFSDMIKSKINKSLLTLIRGQYGFISLVLLEIKCIVFVWRCPPVQIFYFCETTISYVFSHHKNIITEKIIIPRLFW